MEFASECEKSDIAEVCKRLGLNLQMVEDTSLQELMDEFNEKYYMITLLDSWKIRKNPELVAKYISGKVR